MNPDGKLLPIDLGNSVLHTRFDIIIRVERDGPIYRVYDSSIGLDAFSLDESEILNEVEDTLRFLWRNYALAPDEKLSVSAIDLANRLRSAFIELPHERPGENIDTHPCKPDQNVVR